ncbi:MAG: class I SAM-dependent methyltransferase [Candidatus Omnitrophica bacterium]|nr:class I SAM-dependent methyltransferase [Candidatus Omnitrophota bacterium]
MTKHLELNLGVASSAKNYNNWVYSHLKPYLSGAVLDIGSGYGAIAKLINTPQVNKLVLTDLNVDMLSALEKVKLHVKDHHVMSLDITDDASVKQAPFRGMDIAMCLNVLEHIEDDARAVANIGSLLKKDGQVLILVPALRCVYGELDASVGHFRRYQRGTLRTAMEKGGLQVEDIRYMNFFGPLTWYISGKILKRKHFDLKSCRRLDRIVPVLRGIDKLMVRPPFGQSLFAVGRKV